MTATDLVTAFEEAAGRRGHHNFAGVLAQPLGVAEHAPSRIQVIYDVICDEEWMPNLLRWHSQDAVTRPPAEIDAAPAAPSRPEAEPAGAS
jgi:hypothetical protein